MMIYISVLLTSSYSIKSLMYAIETIIPKQRMTNQSCSIFQNKIHLNIPYTLGIMIIRDSTGRKLPRRSERIPIIQERARKKQEFMMEMFRKAKHLYRQYRPYPSELIGKDKQLLDTCTYRRDNIVTFRVEYDESFNSATAINESLISNLEMNVAELKESFSHEEEPEETEPNNESTINEVDSFQMLNQDSTIIHSIIELAPNSFKIIYEGKVSSTEDCLSFIQQSYEACYDLKDKMVDD